MLDRGDPGEKILDVPAHDPFQNGVFDVADQPAHSLKEVEHFFQVYKDLEGKRVQVVGWEKSGSGTGAITESIERYDARYAARNRLLLLPLIGRGAARGITVHEPGLARPAGHLRTHGGR